MRAKKSASNQVAKPKSYRITDADANTIKKKHGSVTEFINVCVSREVKLIQKKKASKPKVTKA